MAEVFLELDDDADGLWVLAPSRIVGTRNKLKNISSWWHAIETTLVTIATQWTDCNSLKQRVDMPFNIYTLADHYSEVI